ncbi:hypothetical protein D3C84_1286240 [compost metagenome]
MGHEAANAAFPQYFGVDYRGLAGPVIGAGQRPADGQVATGVDPGKHCDPRSGSETAAKPRRTTDLNAQ